MTKLLKKLFGYYGSGVSGLIGIVTHGAGGIIQESPVFVIVVVVLAAAVFAMIIVVWLFFSKNKEEKQYYILMIYGIMSIFGLPFGYSAGITALIPLMAWTCCVVNRVLTNGVIRC